MRHCAAAAQAEQDSCFCVVLCRVLGTASAPPCCLCAGGDPGAVMSHLLHPLPGSDPTRERLRRDSAPLPKAWRFGPQLVFLVFWGLPEHCTLALGFSKAFGNNLFTCKEAREAREPTQVWHLCSHTECHPGKDVPTHVMCWCSVHSHTHLCTHAHKVRGFWW